MAASDDGVYAISRLSPGGGLPPPARGGGAPRLYSDDDVVRLERIRDLLAEGLNLVGIARVLELEDEVDRLRAQLGEGQDEQSA